MLIKKLRKIGFWDWTFFIPGPKKRKIYQRPHPEFKTGKDGTTACSKISWRWVKIMWNWASCYCYHIKTVNNCHTGTEASSILQKRPQKNEAVSKNLTVHPKKFNILEPVPVGHLSAWYDLSQRNGLIRATHFSGRWYSQNPSPAACSRRKWPR